MLHKIKTLGPVKIEIGIYGLLVQSRSIKAILWASPFALCSKIRWEKRAIVCLYLYSRHTLVKCFYVGRWDEKINIRPAVFCFQTDATAQCLKITEKVSFNIASEASYIHNFSWQKFIKNDKTGWFWRIFQNLKIAVKQCYQTSHF